MHVHWATKCVVHLIEIQIKLESLWMKKNGENEALLDLSNRQKLEKCNLIGLFRFFLVCGRRKRFLHAFVDSMACKYKGSVFIIFIK